VVTSLSAIKLCGRKMPPKRAFDMNESPCPTIGYIYMIGNNLGVSDKV
jgi:hypothetical protein